MTDAAEAMRRFNEALGAPKHFTRSNIDPDLPVFELFRKRALTKAMRVDGPFRVEAREGVLTCPDGYLAIDAHGWPYPIAKDEFDAIYEPAPTTGSSDGY